MKQNNNKIEIIDNEDSTIHGENISSFFLWLFGFTWKNLSEKKKRWTMMIFIIALGVRGDTPHTVLFQFDFEYVFFFLFPFTHSLGVFCATDTLIRKFASGHLDKCVLISQEHTAHTQRKHPSSRMKSEPEYQPKIRAQCDGMCLSVNV